MAGPWARTAEIYAAPGVAGINMVLVIDPETDSTATIGPIAAPGAWPYLGVVAAPNGKLYGVPCTATTLLRIDPHAKGNFSLATLLSAFFNKW